MKKKTQLNLTKPMNNPNEYSMKWVLYWIQGQSSPSIFKEKNSTFYMKAFEDT